VLRACLLVLLVTGCAAASGHQQLPPDPRPLNGATSLANAQSDALDNATGLRIASCMRSRGFGYQSQPADNDRRPDDPSPYALITLPAAQSNGYGIVAAVLNHPAKPSRDPNASLLNRLSGRQRQAWMAALTGTPTHVHYVTVTSGMVLQYNADGCVHMVNEQLYGRDWDALSAQVHDDANTVIQQTTQTGAVTAAVANWASCMRRAGFAVSHLDDLRGQIEDQLATATSQHQLIALGRTELADAVADARCQATTHVASTIAAAQTRVEAALPTSVHQRVSSYLTDLTHALKLAMSR